MKRNFHLYGNLNEICLTVPSCWHFLISSSSWTNNPNLQFVTTHANPSSVGQTNKSMVYSLPNITSVLLKNVSSFPSCDSCSYFHRSFKFKNSDIVTLRHPTILITKTMFVNSDVSFNFNGKWNTERHFWTNWIRVSYKTFMLATQVGCFGQNFVLELKNL